MEMTIDKALNAFKYFRVYDTYTRKCAVETAVEIMRKYQKIEQIVEGWSADPELDSADSMADIKGVIDGNNNH